MTPEQWQRVKTVFHAVRALPDGERSACLDTACAGDESLRAELEALLGCHDRAGRFIEPLTGGTADLGPEARVGRQIGRYTLMRVLGQGGMAVVYEAEQEHPQRRVALKVMRGGRYVDDHMLRLFQREIRALARLNHPYIAAIHEAGRTEEGENYLVMELVHGERLDGWAARLGWAKSGTTRETVVLGRSQRQERVEPLLQMFVKVCEAVAYAHLHGVIHRDIKPGNILVTGEAIPKILDFGLARMTEPDSALTATVPGKIQGTLAYMSPEQARGHPDEIDTRTDVYALGVVLYELLTGRQPYPTDGALADAIRHITDTTPAPPSTCNRLLNYEIDAIVGKALAKEPERRYASADALLQDIQHYLAGEAIDAKRDSTWYVLKKLARRHSVPFGAAAAAVVLIIGAAIGMTLLYQRARQAERVTTAKSVELAEALSRSNIERGRALAAARDAEMGEDEVWSELSHAGVTRIDGPEAGFAGAPAALHAYWALWDIFQRSRRLATLITHGKPVCLLYFDQAGQRLCSLDANANMLCWSAATWEPVRDTSLVAPIDGVSFDYALRAGGDIAVFGGGVLRVIDPETGSVEAQVDDPDDQAVTGAFSPDGTLLATIGRDNRLRIKDGRSLATVFTMAESTICDTAGARCKPTFSLDGSLVAAAHPGTALGLWNTTSGMLERTLRPPDSLAHLVRNRISSHTIAFGPDGTIAAALGLHPVVWPADGSGPLDLGEPGGRIHTVAFLPGSEGRTLVSSGDRPGGGRGLTILWGLATNARVATIRQVRNLNTCIFSPDGRLIVMGTMRHTVQVHETAPDPHVEVLQSGGGGHTATAALSPDGRLVALTTAPAEGETGRDVLLMDHKSGTTISRFHREGSQILGLEFARDGLSLFEGEASGRIMQWDLPSGTAGREFVAPDPTSPGASEHRREPIKTGRIMGGWNHLRLSSDGSVLARSRRDGLIDLWDVPSGRWIDWLDSGTTETAAIDFSPDGKTLVARHPEKCVLWDMQTRQPKRTITTDKFFPAVRFSTDGAVIAHGVMSCIQFFDAGTGRVLSENKFPGTTGMGMVFHPGGSIFFASDFDSSIRLWDTRTGRELLSLQKHIQPVTSLLVTPDGNTLISSDTSGMVLAWDLTYYNGHIRRELAYRTAHLPETLTRLPGS